MCKIIRNYAVCEVENERRILDIDDAGLWSIVPGKGGVIYYYRNIINKTVNWLWLLAHTLLNLTLGLIQMDCY